jgi:hypothetical protein
MSNITNRLERLDLENAALRKENEDYRVITEKQADKIKRKKEAIEELKNNIRQNYATDVTQNERRLSSKPRNSSQKRKKRGSSQKREYSNRRHHSSEQAKLITMLQDEIGGSDVENVTLMPVDIPILKEEEQYFVSNMVKSIEYIKEDMNFNILVIKSVARIKSLNKICCMLKSELSLSDDKIETIVKKYQHSVEEGEHSDRKMIEVQKEKYTKDFQNLNQTTLSQKNGDLEKSNLMYFNRSTPFYLPTPPHNDSNTVNATLVSPTKEYNTEQLYAERDYSQIHYSPLREGNEKSRNGRIEENQSTHSVSINQLQKARIPENKMYSG